MEIWKDIAGYEGMYQVSSLGRVKSCERPVTRTDGKPYSAKERILRPGKDDRGYLFVSLRHNGVAKTHKVHRLVAETFIPNGSLFTDTVNHKNEVKTDNRVENLEWLSRGDNARYSFTGSKHYNATPVRCIETGEVFGSAIDACNRFGFDRHAIANCMKKGCRAGGYHWEYVN